MKKLLTILFLLTLFVPVFALTSKNLNDGVVEYEQGYYAGSFYKAVNANEITDPSVQVGKVYKVVRVTANTIYITEFEDGELATQ